MLDNHHVLVHWWEILHVLLHQVLQPDLRELFHEIVLSHVQFLQCQPWLMNVGEMINCLKRVKIRQNVGWRLSEKEV